MSTRMYDALIVGGGPAGSTAAALLAQQGHSVLVVEREAFPRFHIGESLLPNSVPLWKRLGVWEELQRRPFQPKFGATFVFEPRGSSARLDFSTCLDRDRRLAFQVRRADYDELLLNNARRLGAEVWEQSTVSEVVFEEGCAVGARVRRAPAPDDQASPGAGAGAAAPSLDVEARVVLDATGRDTLLGKQLRLKRRDPALRQAALFTHVRGARMGLGPEGGDILVVGGPWGWFWMIPLDAETTSVGVVFPGRVMAEQEGDCQRVFEQLVAASGEVSGRLQDATPIAPVQAVADFSYRCEQFCGDGWALLGDAAGFLDPVFSSGVFLAMHSAERAADLCADALMSGSQQDRVRHESLKPYERFVRRGLDRFRRYILAYYDPGCVATIADGPPPWLRGAAASAFGGKVYERDPRIQVFDLCFFGVSAFHRWRARHGLGQLPEAPASH